MKRLTKRNKDGVAYWLGANGVSYLDNQGNIYGNAIEKLAAYEDAEEEGRLVVLPVKTGDTVYGIFCNEVQPKEITGIWINPYTKPQLWINTKYEFSSGITERIDMALGKTVFMTRAEAEAALEKMKGEAK